ncbi:MAG: VirK/YbjX family protein [Phascolarctobacterium sp.]|uniref:VirK/YbjX family protein n=1 Tax=Phascolarctobacterium sp. TaxID=2049039 RepID=UPI0026DC3B01|nr:VirK/YbjX family protein [Phascolarctobacterium sp.]MDO4920632.1 VirK/YbjX family protein [Phascolarctobacterium sp.]
MEKDILEYVGKSLYHMHVLKEVKRYLVFRARCRLHSGAVNDMLEFFDATPARWSWLKGTPSLLEQTTRAFFYKGSTWDERVALVKNHILFLEQYFQPELMNKLYGEHKRVELWHDSYEDKPLTLNLWFHAGQRKEGCLSLALFYENEALYQIMFWLGKDAADGKPAIFIGALQGPQNGNELIKGLTKAFFGYRTKNLIFYGMRSFAKALGVEQIYAVANEGYYAMNHIRADRKLKTDFGAFWQECEGSQCSDRRFYVMPTAEYRKSMEELKPSKRAQHRRRFAKMDEIEASVAAAVAKYKK